MQVFFSNARKEPKILFLKRKVWGKFHKGWVCSSFKTLFLNTESSSHPTPTHPVKIRKRFGFRKHINPDAEASRGTDSLLKSDWRISVIYCKEKTLFVKKLRVGFWSSGLSHPQQTQS